jgi:hypothetical protein
VGIRISFGIWGSVYNVAELTESPAVVVTSPRRLQISRLYLDIFIQYFIVSLLSFVFPLQSKDSASRRTTGI